MPTSKDQPRTHGSLGKGREGQACRWLAWVRWLALAGGLAPAGVVAGLQVELDIGVAIHDAFSAEGLRGILSLEEGRTRFELLAEAIEWPGGSLTDLRLRCDRVQWTPQRLSCAQASLGVVGEGWSLDRAPLSFDWDRERGLVQFAAPWPRLFEAQGRIEGSVDASGLRVDFRVGALRLRELLASGLLGDELPVEVESGLVDAEGSIDTRGPVTRLGVRFSASALSFSDPVGLRAAEGLELAGDVAYGPRGWAIQLRFTGGAAFFEPWFIDFAEVGAMDLSASALQLDKPSPEGQPWRADSLGLRFGPHIRVDATKLRHTGDRIEEVRLGWDAERLDLAGEWLLQPLLHGTLLGPSRYRGAAAGTLQVAAGEVVALDATWRDVAIVDDLGRFALEDSTGSIRWRDTGPEQESAFRVGSGALYGLPVGSFAIRLHLGPRSLRLPEPVFIPVLDGGLAVDSLAVRLEPGGPEVEFEGGVRALSLDRLTEVLDWPRFSGRLSGIIPRLVLDADGLRVDGRLLVRVFDGEVVLGGLRIRNLFGVAPELEVSADVRRIDLELLTRAFDFGRVEGRLSGTLEDLLLVGWEPQRMRLFLATPAEDPGRRRISQRAVDNLTEIGGGIQAALTAPFLRLFDDFAYRRLGFQCELRGAVCHMSGVADRADGAFVLVQGGGLPRIDVIGHNRRVDWAELVRRLNAVREGGAPVVQ